MTYKSSPQIKGNQLLLSVDGTDYWADCSECAIEPGKADKDSVTFADAANGSATASYSLKFKAIQSTDPKSFWSFIWEHSGETVPFTYAPWGNATPTADKPHFTGKVTVGAKPKIGGAAGNKSFDFDGEWVIEGTPEKVTTGKAVTGAGWDKEGAKPASGSSSS
ncbi:hypothetical protein [uncultured Mobiluncus sp.]|uniref:hypothetical protein n=1 Tax=uncultured Mobiluncus sp. TaxID=293425 RepID=UPI002622F989|nr:hypothetical protein [uncultured Mobiluncus sp.]